MLRECRVACKHRFCTYDMTGFLTLEKLEGLLPAVLHLLKAGEPEESVVHELCFLERDYELDKSVAVDWLGTSIVSLLVKIATMSGSQDMWRLVNSSVSWRSL